MNKYRYSVVIVTYNRLELLKECLEHCFSQSVPFEEIVVVDNHSDDGTEEYLKGLCPAYPALNVCWTEKNIGGAGGFCKALETVDKDRADFILLIDDDAIIDRDYIRNIEPYITEGIGAYSGSVLMPDGSPRQRHMLKSRTFLLLKPVNERMYSYKYFDYDVSSFCGLLISSGLIKECGLPIREYYIWHDDIEYSMRLREKTIFRNINAATLIHKTGQTGSSKRFCWKSYYGGRNSWDVAKKYSAHPLIYDICRIAYHIAGIIAYSALSVLPDNRAYNKAVVKLHRDILKYPFNRKLGINPDYTPDVSSPLS